MCVVLYVLGALSCAIPLLSFSFYIWLLNKKLWKIWETCRNGPNMPPKTNWRHIKVIGSTLNSSTNRKIPLLWFLLQLDAISNRGHSYKRTKCVHEIASPIVQIIDPTCYLYVVFFNMTFLLRRKIFVPLQHFIELK